MGKLAHPLPPSLETDILSLMDSLIARMGLAEYCIWFAAALDGHGNWTDTAPLPEIKSLLQRQAAALLTPAPETA